MELEKQNAPVIPNIDTYKYVLLITHLGGNHGAAAPNTPPNNSTIFNVSFNKEYIFYSCTYNVVEWLMVPEKVENECGVAVCEFA